LHTLLLLGVSLHRTHVTERSSRSVREPLIAIELALRESSELPRAGGNADARQAEPAMQSAARRATVASQVGRLGRSPNRQLASPAAEKNSPVQAEASATGEDRPGDTQSTAPQTGTGTESTASTRGQGGRSHLGPHRSVLGDDFGLAYALSRQEKAPSKTEQAADNLRRSMQQEQADHERKLGLNVPAPLILAIEGAAREVAIPTNSVAVFTANIDGSGQLLGLEYTGSNHASPQWGKLTRRVEQMLRGRKLPIARNVKGVDLKLRLVARAQLPSGSDPGLGVDLMGIPVKKGQGKRSPKITILDPKPVMLELDIPGTNGEEKVKVPIPAVVVSVLSVAADPADIGAPVRHMIRVEVLDEKVY
jgi:hypothetical protein